MFFITKIIIFFLYLQKVLKKKEKVIPQKKRTSDILCNNIDVIEPIQQIINNKLTYLSYKTHSISHKYHTKLT